MVISQYQGRTGAGYSIVDPNTGAGAYLIGGGADGGVLMIIGLTLIVTAIGIAVVSIIGTAPAGGLGALFTIPFAIDAVIAGLALMVKGWEILNYGNPQSPTANPCNAFKAIYGLLLGVISGRLAPLIAPSVNGSYITGSIFGFILGLSDFVGIDFCYKPNEDKE